MKILKLTLTSFIISLFFSFCGTGLSIPGELDESKTDNVNFSKAFGGELGSQVVVKTSQPFNNLVALVSSNLKKLKSTTSTKLSDLGTTGIAVPQGIKLIFSINATSTNEVDPQKLIEFGHYAIKGGKDVTPGFSNIALAKKTYKKVGVTAFLIAVKEAQSIENESDKKKVLESLIENKEPILTATSSKAATEKVKKALDSSKASQAAKNKIKLEDIDKVSNSGSISSSGSSSAPASSSATTGSSSTPDPNVVVYTSPAGASHDVKIKFTPLNSLGQAKLTIEGNAEFKTTQNMSGIYTHIYRGLNSVVKDDNVTVYAQTNLSNKKEFIIQLSTTKANSILDDKVFYIHFGDIIKDYSLYNSSYIGGENFSISMKTKANSTILSKPTGFVKLGEIKSFAPETFTIDTAEVTLVGNNSTKLKLKFNINKALGGIAGSYSTREVDNLRIFIKSENKKWYAVAVVGRSSGLQVLQPWRGRQPALFVNENGNSFVTTSASTLENNIPGTPASDVNQYKLKFSSYSTSEVAINGTDILQGPGKIAITYCPKPYAPYVSDKKGLLGIPVTGTDITKCHVTTQDITIQQE